MDVGDTCTFCCISYLNVSTHLKFVLVSSCWRLSYRYHIDHLEHSGKNVGTGRKLAAAQHVNWHFWQYIVVQMVWIGANFHVILGAVRDLAEYYTKCDITYGMT